MQAVKLFTQHFKISKLPFLCLCVTLPRIKEFCARRRQRSSHLSWPLSSPLLSICGCSKAVDNDSCW